MIIVLLLVGFATQGTQTAKEPAVPIQFRVAETKMDTVTDALYVHCEVENTGPDYISVEPILDFPRAWTVQGKRGEIVKGPVPDMMSKVKNNRSVQLGPYDHQDFQVGLDPLRLTDLMFYQAQPSRITIRLKYIIENQTQPNEPKQFITVTPQAPYLGVLCGLGIGVFAYTTILVLYAKAAHRKVVLGDYWIKGGLALVSVIVASFAFRYLGIAVPALPVKFDIKNIYGGIALGFFSQPIVEWLGRLAFYPKFAVSGNVQTLHPQERLRRAARRGHLQEGRERQVVVQNGEGGGGAPADGAPCVSSVGDSSLPLE
jgi:hypothetical protein